MFARPLGLLVIGDYLSSVEIPWISEGGSLHDYRATLARLAPLVEAAEVVVPGHGPYHGRDTALRLLDEDVDYLDALERGESVKLSGFGNFQLRDKPQRPGRNPKTGEAIPISARRVVTFHASQKLKAMVERAPR